MIWQHLITKLSIYTRTINTMCNSYNSLISSIAQWINYTLYRNLNNSIKTIHPILSLSLISLHQSLLLYKVTTKQDLDPAYPVTLAVTHLLHALSLSKITVPMISGNSITSISYRCKYKICPYLSHIMYSVIILSLQILFNMALLF